MNEEGLFMKTHTMLLAALACVGLSWTPVKRWGQDIGPQGGVQTQDKA